MNSSLKLVEQIGSGLIQEDDNRIHTPSAASIHKSNVSAKSGSASQLKS
mgnify:CR=1 FL=1